MVDVARFFLDFVQDESCGKCPPCRVGTKRMLEIVTRICEGKGEEGDIERLDRPGRQDQGHGPVRPGPDGAEPGPLDDPLLPPRVRGPHPRQAVPGGRLPGPGAGPVPERLPGRRGRARLRLAHRREALRRGPAAAPRAEPVRVGLRAGLLPHLRGQVPPGAAGRAGVHPRPQAVHGRAGSDRPAARGPRERARTPSARSPSSGPGRRAWRARTSWPGWATSRRSYRGRAAARRHAGPGDPGVPAAARGTGPRGPHDRADGRDDRDRQTPGQGLHPAEPARRQATRRCSWPSAPRWAPSWAFPARTPRAWPRPSLSCASTTSAGRPPWARMWWSSAAATRPSTRPGRPCGSGPSPSRSSTAARGPRCPPTRRRSTRPSTRASGCRCWWPRSRSSSRTARSTGVKCRHMVLGEFDRSGRRRPVAGGGEFVVEADQVIAGIGQALDAADLRRRTGPGAQQGRVHPRPTPRRARRRCRGSSPAATPCWARRRWSRRLRPASGPRSASTRC